MFEDDPGSPLKKTARTLDMMSVEELEDRVASLKADIVAAEAMIDAKRKQKAAADAIFGKKGE